MFGGVIEATGVIRASEPCASGRRLAVSAERYWAGAALGASVAVDGVCLTIAAIRGDDAVFDVVSETLRRSTLGDMRPGEAVNLQKSLVVGDRVEGHFVQGHVDAVGTVARVDRSAAESRWWFTVDRQTMVCIVPKGSAAVDGISLTIAEVAEAMFSVALIPTTLERTTIGRKRIGDRVNIETDIVARTVVRYLQLLGGSPMDRSDSVSREFLQRHGLA